MKPYFRNPRRITDKRQARLTDTLARLGDLGGIVHNLETDEVIGGNQRMAVFKDGQPVVVEAYDQPDEQGTVGHGFIVWRGKKYAYRQVRWEPETAAEANIAANIGAGDWDWDMLKQWDASELQSYGFEQDLLKSWQADAEALGAMLAEDEQPAGEDPGAQTDKAAELQVKWQVESGQLWALGEHRLICGDCTDRTVVERVMGGEKADLLLSDPPYGKLKIFNSSGAVGNAGDNLAKVRHYGAYEGAHGFDIKPMLAALDGCYSKAIIWGGNYFTDILPVTASWLIWDKRAGAQLFYADCELAWSDLGITAKVFTFTWQGMIRAGDKIERYHPTQKPVELYEWCLGLADKAVIVLDPTLGSASSLIACEKLGRRARCIEISPPYCAVTLERWSTMTGQTPVLLNPAAPNHDAPSDDKQSHDDEEA